jgi:uncharacterized protein YoaH (UPF0181 family)
MDERPGEGPEQPDPSGRGEEGDEPVGAPAGPVSDAPTGPAAPEEELTPEARALAEEAAEIRRLVEEGAGSPEAIRALAARLREHRAREEELWRTAVKPALVKEGKGRLRGHPRPAPVEPLVPGHDKSSQLAWVGGGLLFVVVTVILAANTSVWVLLLPVLALLGWAWYQGRDTTAGQ